jgi:dTMP kinase
MDKGIFITFEGGEGGGKTTQAKLLSKWLGERNIESILTKEPGAPSIPECINFRKLLLDPKYDLVPTSELMLFLADRAQHVEKLIKPSLEKGVHVICDRFSDSTRVYQCARGLSRQKIDILLEFATGGLVPDLTFLLDTSVETGFKRKKSDYKGGDRMENAGNRFHEDVRHGFLKLAESMSEQHRFRIISTELPKTVKEVHEEVVEHVSKRLWVEDGE